MNSAYKKAKNTDQIFDSYLIQSDNKYPTNNQQSTLRTKFNFGAQVIES